MGHIILRLFSHRIITIILTCNITIIINYIININQTNESMKKIFTLLFALIGLTSAVSAATVDDLQVIKHSMVINFADVTNNGQAKPGKGNLFASGYVLDVTGGSVATNKGESNPSAYVSADGTIDFTVNYAEYGVVKNTFRLKNAQDVIAMKVTAGSKIHFLGQVHASRYPKVSLKADMSDAFTLTVNTTSVDGYSQWVADDDYTIYVGSEGGDWYLGYIIIEANEAPGTPSVTLGAQTYENGLWFREVTCKPALAEGMPTLCTYTTDGTEPTAASPVYTAPIRIYKDCEVKFQAFMDMGDGAAYEGADLADASNNAVVEFSFNAPAIQAEGPNVTIVTEYENATNMVEIGAGAGYEAGSEFILEESATVSAYTVIKNGDYCNFESKKVIQDVYVLDAIAESTTIAVTAGEVVKDEEASATSTNGDVFVVENGAISADKKHFFVKNLEFAVVNGDNAKYQVPAGQEIYIKMNNTNISFLVADSVNVKVVFAKNSCKTLNPTNDESVTTDRKVYVNVDGTNYGNDDITAGDVENLDGYANTVEFGLASGIHTFKKYSGTGNILISTIEITPVVGEDGIQQVTANAAAKTIKAIENGQLVIKSAKGTFSVAGAQLK